jgi:hypothetical protein
MFKPTNQALGCTWRGFAQPGMNCKNKNLEGGSMRNDGSSGMKNHPIVSHKEWLSARTAFLTTAISQSVFSAELLGFRARVLGLGAS